MDSYLWRPEENLNVLVVVKPGFHALGCMAGRIILYKDLGASLLLTRPEVLLKDVSVGVLVATLLASFLPFSSSLSGTMTRWPSLPLPKHPHTINFNGCFTATQQHNKTRNRKKLGILAFKLRSVFPR